jgi:hypothetical protein
MIEFETSFIPQNIAPKGTNRIICFDENGKRVGRIGLYDLILPHNIGTKLYSFGAISDVHLGNSYPTSTNDFAKALSYFKNKVKFVCVCGDCTAYGSDYDCGLWKSAKESSGLTLYEVAGNHDARPLYDVDTQTFNEKLTDERFQKYFEHNLFYTKEQGDDLFIFLSMNTWDNYHGHGSMETFADKDLDSLEATLNNNKGKRIFLFQHCFYWEGSGNPNQSYGYDLMRGDQGTRFFNLLRNNPNVIWFHGHSHIIFETQKQFSISNYDNELGCHSIHIPSLTQPKHLIDGVSETIDESSGTSVYSQGYVVDVYKNHIVLNGINFVTGKQLPIATYCLNTELQNIVTDTSSDITETTTN